MSNLVNSSGVIASDVSGVGTARQYCPAAELGGISSRKAIFAYGQNSGGSNVSMSNLVSTSGVIASDVTGVGTARRDLGAAGYGSDKAIYAYGYASGYVSMSNLVSNSGVIGSDVSGVGSARAGVRAAGYGADKAIFAYGYNAYVSMSNLVNNSGVIGSDVTGVGTARGSLGAAGYSTSA